ncbi:deSI-like protein At4g17486 isoform X3 [Phoenix dactylifera]|uniref:DeSI-like protein At4g17486 isoform X3 n=1 Tax=Phoenix dactylifera TaxID=42345 RepID=A0A8B7MV67_PHODC|nr:deSI-like protein At4g17486 isoform X3 [Phoenix dactylifera]
MGCVFSSRSTSSDESGVPVVLNIYDLTPLNNYMYWFGLGIFHSGIEDYHGDTYHLISKNCNHFTDDVSLRLTGRPIPGWVNRLARLGTVCNCLLPESLRLPAAKQISEYHGFSEDVSESFSFITTTTHDLIESDDADQDKHLLSPSSDREVTSVKELDR